MHQLLAKQYVASIKRRASQGDCPTEAPLSVEALEDLALTLDALSSLPAQAGNGFLTDGPADPDQYAAYVTQELKRPLAERLRLITHVGPYHLRNTPNEAADALSSIPEQGVGVKPLEWEEINGKLWDAEAIGTFYRIKDLGGRLGGRFVLALNGLGWRGEAKSLDEAKAAAQADYEARILSALVAPSQPAAVGVTDEMVEAIVQAVRPYTHRTLFLDEHRDLVRTALRSTP